MDKILPLLDLLGWGCWEASRGIYFSSHKKRRDYDREDHPAITEGWGLGGVSPMPEAVLKAQPTHTSHREWIKIRYFIM